MNVGFQHRLEIVSRSRRAAATLLVIDLDDTVDTLQEVAAKAAQVAYSTISSPELHAELAQALLLALEGVEMLPGQPAEYGSELADGRLARVTRTVSKI